MTEPMHDISVEGFIESFDRRYPTFILKTLLCDRTTGRNIIWADNEYEALGEGYMGDEEITVEKITGMNSGVIMARTRAASRLRLALSACGYTMSDSATAPAANASSMPASCRTTAMSPPTMTSRYA